jgi:hypothetical protein
VKKFFKIFIFFAGWVLSPFTWWNDAFVNIPISYLLANIIFYLTHLSFKWLVMGSYWFTNILGIALMYSGGKQIIMLSKNRVKAALFLIVFVIVYSAVMLYLDRYGKLKPLL